MSLSLWMVSSYKARKDARGFTLTDSKSVKKDPISVTHPELAAQLKDQSLGDVLTHGSHKKVAWVCDLAHEWEARVLNRTSGHSGCPYCAGKRAIPGETDLGTLRPDLACELKDQSLATTLTVSSDKKVWWACKDFGHDYETTPDKRTRHGHGCPYCVGQRVLAGFNDLGTLRPDVACELKDQSLASQLTVGSNKKVWWVCDLAHEWEARVNSRTNKGAGCPACAKHGFDQTKPAFIYLVAQKALHDEDAVVVKLGIANVGSLETRLAKHAKQGLTEVLSTQGYLFGHKAAAKETEFKRYLRALPTKYRVAKDELPDGYTEAFLSTAPDWREHAA